MTHFSGALPDLPHKEKVTVAGLVTRFRSHQTKKGDMMGFVTLEDIQGVIELVLFPRAWAQFAGLIVMDRVVQGEGRLDNEGGDPKVLVDRLAEVFVDSENAGSGGEIDPYLSYLPDEENPVPQGSTASNIESRSSSPTRMDESFPSSPIYDWHDMPPQPPPPDDWEGFTPADSNPKLNLAVETLAVAESSQTQYSSPSELSRSEPQRSIPSVDSPPSKSVDPAAGLAFELPVVQRKEPVLEPSPMRYLVSPQLSSEETPGEIRMIKVILRSTGDKRRDVLRLRRAHGMLRSVPGRDKFALMVFEGGGRYLMEFPNETTGITSDLIRALTAMVGEGNVSVETIKVL